MPVTCRSCQNATSDSVCQKWGLRVHTSKKILVDADGAGPWTTLSSNDLDSPAYQQKFLPDGFIQTKVVTGLCCSQMFKVDLTLGLTL